jgi:hypothetical protein
MVQMSTLTPQHCGRALAGTDRSRPGLQATNNGTIYLLPHAARALRDPQCQELELRLRMSLGKPEPRRPGFRRSRRLCARVASNLTRDRHHVCVARGCLRVMFDALRQNQNWHRSSPTTTIRAALSSCESNLDGVGGASVYLIKQKGIGPQSHGRTAMAEPAADLDHVEDRRQ